MLNKFDDIQNWNFDVDEISAGVYRVRAWDNLGRNIEVEGTDPDALLEECKKYALRIVRDDKRNLK